MEFADGSTAETGNGGWFHHAVLANVGMDIKDPNCGVRYLETVFMSGNEKSEGMFNYLNTTIKSGYHILPNDTFLLNTELMNMDNNEKWVWPTMTYDYIEGEHPEYKDSKIIWMSIGAAGCGKEANPFGPPNATEDLRPYKEKFSEHSIPWQIPRDGILLGSQGHMHDGATSMDLFIGEKKVCTTVSTYAKATKGGMGVMGSTGSMGSSASGGHPHDNRRRQVLKGGNATNTEIEHIEKQLPCIYDPPIQFTKGQKMHIVANYDFQQHPGMKDDQGNLDQIMGIAGSAVAFPYPREA